MCAKKASDKDVGDKQLDDLKKQKEEIDARMALLEAKLGDFGKASYTGGVTLEKGAGQLEAQMLAACTLSKIGQAIGERVKAAQREEQWHVAMYLADTPPSFDDLYAFRARKRLAETTMLSALELVAPAVTAAEPEESGPAPLAVEESGMQSLVPPVAAAGLALETVDKVLSYLRSDYTAGSITTTANQKSLLMEIARGVHDKANARVSVPCLYAPCINDAENSEVVTALLGLATTRSRIDEKIRAFDADLTAVNEGLRTVDPKNKQQLKDRAKGLQYKLDRLRQAGSLYDTLVDATFKTSDSATATTNLLKQAELRRTFDEAHVVLLVNLDGVSSSFYTKKGFFETIGRRRRLPVHFSGGMVVSYSLYWREAGNIIDSGTIPMISEYVCMDDMQDYVERRTGFSTISSI